METTYSWTDECAGGLEKADPQYERFSRIISELNESSDKAIARRLRTEMVLDWRDEYNVGVREIDFQHKKFFKLIRKMSDLHLKGSGSTDEAADLDRLLNKLLKYAEFHFQSEEELMEQYGYPMIEHQKKEHAVILSELNRQVVAIRFAGGSRAKLVYFLTQWFIKHTVYSDKEVGLFIMQQRKAQAFLFNLKEAAHKMSVFLNQPLTTRDIMSFLNQPINVWGEKDTLFYSIG